MKKNETKHKQIEEGRYSLKEQFQPDRAIKWTKIRENIQSDTNSKKTHRKTERDQGNLRLSEAKPMVPQKDGLKKFKNSQ